MKFYVGNCTKQNYELHYRLPEALGARMQPIRAGGQILIAGDLSPKDVESLEKQLRRYGATLVTDIDRTRAFVGLCFQVDKPIKVDALGRAIEHNDAVLTAKGQEIRRTVAVAINQKIERQLEESRLPETLNDLEITVDEVDSRSKPVAGGIKEGVRVSKDAPEKPLISTQRQRPRRVGAA